MRPKVELLWTPGNIAHIARHRVDPTEVQEVCDGTPVREPGYGGRTLLIGPTLARRMLTIVLELQANGAWLVITARPASRRERANYQNQRTQGDVE